MGLRLRIFLGMLLVVFLALASTAVVAYYHAQRTDVAYNEQRLTGLHETQSIDQFSYGVSDRGASIRIPIITVEKGYKGWLEDRRPASNADPYKIAARIIKTVKSA